MSCAGDTSYLRRTMSILAGDLLNPAPVSTLREALDRIGGKSDVWLTVHAGVNRQTFGGAVLSRLARCWARSLREAGVQRGDRVALLLPNDIPFVAAFFGCQYLGAVPVPLAWPVSLLDLNRVLDSLGPLVANAAPRVIVTTPAVASMKPFGLPAVVAPHPVPARGLVAPAKDDPAFIQYTSGSLGRPRGVVITQQAAVASAWSMGQALGVGRQDVGVSWLPLFHDMGLVGGLLCPLLYRFPLHLMSPGEFLLHPRRWLRLISEEKGTVATAPDFAYALCARRVKDLAGLDLSSWRHALSGSEPVHRSTLDAFAEQFAPTGFSARALKPVYGLAENTLGVCFGDGEEPDAEWQGRTICSVGRPIPGMEVQISESGEVLVRGPSRMTVYFRDPEATARTVRDGWLHTGDLGFICDGRLYLTGREKDLVIQNGRKFHPYDIERIAAAAVDAMPNGAAAFADADEALVVVVETREQLDDVEKRVRGELMAALGVRPSRVVQVGLGELPRTSSGKLRRNACVERFT